MKYNNVIRVLILSILLLALITSAYGEDPPWIITYQPPSSLLPVVAIVDVKAGALIGPFVGSADMTGKVTMISPTGKPQDLKNIRMGDGGYSRDVNLDEVGDYTIEENYTLTVEVSFLSVLIRAETFTKTHKWNYNNTTAGIKTFSVISNLSNFSSDIEGPIEIYSSSLSSIEPGAEETVSVMIKALDDVKKDDEILVSSITLSGLWDKVSSIATDNTPPTIFISDALQSSPNSDVRISFTLIDVDNALCIVESEYRGGSVSSWTPAAMSGANVSPGSRILYWKSIMDEPNGQGLYNIRMRASDRLSYSSWASRSVTLNNTLADPNTPPSAGNVHMIVLDGSTNEVVSRNPVTGDKLKAGYTFHDDEGDSESGSRLNWYRGFGEGVLQQSVSVSSEQGRILSEPTFKGERWRFEITPSDGKNSGDTRRSATVTIGNAAPGVTYARIQPYTPNSRPNSKDDLRADYDYHDPENDPEGSSEILWYKNGILQSLYNGLSTLPASATTRGDQWYFSVRPRDVDGAYGDRLSSSSVTVVNQKPIVEIVSVDGQKDADGEFFGDITVTYNLKDADEDLCKLSVYYQGGSAGLAKMAAHVLEANEGKSNITQVPPANGLILTWQSASNEPSGRASDYRIGIIADDNADNVDRGEGVSARFSVDNNSEPVATDVAISPASPFSSDDLTASYKFEDQDGDSEINSEIRWFKNGDEQMAYRNQKVISYSLTKRDEQWYFTIRPKDGKEFGVMQTSPIVKINNAPPVAKDVRLEPKNVSSDDNLEAFYTYSDADGDPEGDTIIKWYMNGSPQAEYEGQMLVPATAVSRDQIWYFTVQPSDGTTLGEIVESNHVAVGNVAPEVRGLTLPQEVAFRDVAIKVDLWDADDDKCSLEVEYSGGNASDWTKATIKESLQALSRGLVTLTWQSAEDENVQNSTNFQIRVTPDDGIVKGETVISGFFVVDNNEPPIASNLQILPLNPTTSDNLTASYEFMDPDGGQESGSDIIWYKDSVQTSYIGSILIASGTLKGQMWHYTVKPKDGSKFGELQTSAPATILNSPPEARNLVIIPDAPSSGDTLTARYDYHDLDEDKESETEIEWYKNGALMIKTTVITNEDKSLPTPVSKGESWHCVVRPKDGFDFGAPVTSAAVGVGNAVPVVQDVVVSGDSGDVTIEYSLIDGDGDRCELTVQYQGGSVPESKWGTASIKEAITGVEPGVGLRLTWVSDIDELGQKADNYIIRIIPADGVSTGTIGMSPKFSLNNNSLPTATDIYISPAEPTTSSDLEVNYTFVDPDGDPEGRPEISWYKGEIQETLYDNRTVLPASATARGDEWYFDIKVSDGKDYGWAQLSPRVTIKNSPPEATNVVLNPRQPDVGEQLTAQYTYVDADGDPIDKVEIRWYRDNMPRSEFDDYPFIPAIYTIAGDEWYFTVTVWDAFEAGSTQISNKVFVSNEPPMASSLNILPSSPFTTDDLDLSYVYTDPERDPEDGSKIVWYKNGEAQTKYNDVDPLPSSATARDQVWYFTVQPKDGKQFGEVQESDFVIIKNTPPRAENLYISPPYPRSTDGLVAKYDFVDADGDSEGRSEIRWYMNDTWMQAYNGLGRLPSKETLSGQIWNFAVIPKDDKDTGEMVSSESVEIDSPIPRATGLSIIPSAPKTTDDLEAIYSYSDPRGLPEGDSKIVWYKNGEALLEYSNSRFLPSDVTSRGDQWSFSYVPVNAGGLSGEEQHSLPVIVVNSAPALMEVKVQPDEPTTDDTLVVDYIFYDPDGDAEARSEIKWFRKGFEKASYVLQPAYDDWTELPDSATKRGERWYFTLRSRDDAIFSLLATSEPVTIGNGRPSVIDVNVSPTTPLTDEDLEVFYTYIDTEGDIESGTRIRWFKNDLPQLEHDELKVVPADATARDDSWYCTVEPGDGVDIGEKVTSNAVTIGNTPPVVLELRAEVGQVLRGDSALIISNGVDADLEDNGPNETLICQIAYRIGIDAWTALIVEHNPTSERWEAPFSPGPGTELGEYDFRARFVDGVNEASDWETREKMITVGNSPPIITADADNLLVPEDTVREINLREYGTDVEDKTLIWALDANSVNEDLFQASISDNGILVITPMDDMNGQDDITLTVTDKDGGKAEKADVTIIIDPINDKPSIPASVKITPENPKTTDRLICTASGSVDPDGDEVIYGYQWYKNEELQDAIKVDSVPSAETSKGEVWRCEVTPTDGRIFGPSRSDDVTVANSLPEVTIRAVTGDTKDIQINFDLRDADDDDCDLQVEYWIKSWKPATVTGAILSVKQREGLTLTWQSHVDEVNTVTDDCRLRIMPKNGLLSGSSDESKSFPLDNLSPGLTVTAIANSIHPHYIDVTVVSDEKLAETPHVSAVLKLNVPAVLKPHVSAALNEERIVELDMQSIDDAILTGEVELEPDFDGAIWTGKVKLLEELKELLEELEELLKGLEEPLEKLEELRMELEQGLDVSVLVLVQGTDLVGNIGEMELQENFQIPSPPPTPAGFILRQNYPNPINTDTNIPYELPRSLIVTIKIYNVTGRGVRTLDEGYKVAGLYLSQDRAARWDGRDDNGIMVASGVYFYCLKAGEFTAVKKMIVSR